MRSHSSAVRKSFKQQQEVLISRRIREYLREGLDPIPISILTVCRDRVQWTAQYLEDQPDSVWKRPQHLELTLLPR
jgi:hypothetical protein